MSNLLLEESNQYPAWPSPESTAPSSGRQRAVGSIHRAWAAAYLSRASSQAKPYVRRMVLSMDSRTISDRISMHGLNGFLNWVGVWCCCLVPTL